MKKLKLLLGAAALASVTGVSDPKLGYVSRVEGISSGPQQIALDDSGREKIEAPSAALAFASMKEVPAAPEAKPQAVAAAQPAAPSAAPAPASDETPFYKKMFGNVADLFSTSPQPTAETAQAAPAAAPAAVPAARPPAKSQKRVETTTGVKVAQARN